MTDAHCHVSCGDSSVREFLIGRDFFGVHPWETLGEEFKVESLKCKEKVALPHGLETLRTLLLAHPNAGVGEIGLDRLKVRDVPPLMREVFIEQLKLAFELHRPVVLHGAKCWGQVVDTIKNEELRMKNGGNGRSCAVLQNSPLPPLLFHGFSRSDGLIPDIVKLNGFISVGPAVLNDHAVNYRELVKKIPLERLLLETDRVATTDNGQPTVGTSIEEILVKTAELRGVAPKELEKITDENAEKFIGASL